MNYTARFTGSDDINSLAVARKYINGRAKDAVACWASFTQEQRDQHHVVSFAKYLAKHW